VHSRELGEFPPELQNDWFHEIQGRLQYTQGNLIDLASIPNSHELESSIAGGHAKVVEIESVKRLAGPELSFGKPTAPSADACAIIEQGRIPPLNMPLGK